MHTFTPISCIYNIHIVLECKNIQFMTKSGINPNVVRPNKKENYQSRVIIFGEKYKAGRELFVRPFIDIER